jgi:hypothetical protein
MLQNSMCLLVLGHLLVGMFSQGTAQTSLPPATSVNLALQKPAIQSSTFFRAGSVQKLAVANLAVDGNADSNVDHGSCATTTNTAKGWWAVDLEKVSSIHRVRIQSRRDNPTLYQQLQNIFIGLTNVSPWNPVTPPNLAANQSSVCKYFAGHVPFEIPLDIFCEPNTKAGRYLFVKATGVEHLTICELEAYAN